MVEKTDIDIQSIGTDEEVKAWKDFFEIIKNTESSDEEIKESYINLMSILIKNMRKEYGISDIEIKMLRM